MRILHDTVHPDQVAPVLAILLPGALQPPEEFVQAGLVAAVRARRLPVDLAMLDLGIGYLSEAIDGSVLERLHEQVVQPVLRQPYRAIWLAGLSIGGFMAMAYADRYPGNVHGLCLLAPYPGNRILTGEIRAAGGIARWRAPHATDDGEVRVWQWMQRYRPQPPMPALHFAYGRQDRFAPDQQLLAAGLDAECVDTVDGRHDWPTWRQLWDNFLDRAAPRFLQSTADLSE